MESPLDYAKSGLKINLAVLDQLRKFPDKARRPDYILWDGYQIKTYDWIDVPCAAIVRFEFISSREEIAQGFDAKLDGWFELEQGERIPLLRTWKDNRYEDTVTYPFLSKDGKMGIWNIYKVNLPNGQIIEEKLGGNAGFWVEQVSSSERIYHCSPAMLNPPDFEALVFKVTIIPPLKEKI